MCAFSQWQFDIHPIDTCDHRRNVKDDRQCSQKLNRLVQVIREDDVIGVAETADGLDSD